jgi:hypothetical protein
LDDLLRANNEARSGLPVRETRRNDLYGPSSLLAHADCLARVNEKRFGDTLDRMIARVGRGFYPNTAEDFVRPLSQFLEA